MYYGLQLLQVSSGGRTFNMTNTTLIANVSSSIGNAFFSTIGVGGSIGYMLVGAIILLVFMILIWKSGLGVYGMIVIIPALIGILTTFLLPEWINAVVWIIVGSIWALILLRFFREG